MIVAVRLCREEAETEVVLQGVVDSSGDPSVQIRADGAAETSRCETGQFFLR